MSDRPEDEAERLYAASYRRLVGQLTAMTGDAAEAEDLVQEAFARALAQWSKLRDYDDPEAWLRTVAMNLARSRWRRGKRTAAVMLRLRAAHEDVAAPSPDHVALVQALRDLPASQREALVLFHVADLPVETIARELGVPSGTVKARLSRGRAALAGRLAEEEDEGLRRRRQPETVSLDTLLLPDASPSDVGPDVARFSGLLGGPGLLGATP